MYSNSNITPRHILIGLIVFSVSSILLLSSNSYRMPLMRFEKDLYQDCFTWKSTDHSLLTVHSCPHYSQMNSLVWTYDGTGLMKYIQWIAIRKIAKMRITRLDNDCLIVQERFFPSQLTTDHFVQVYILSQATNLTDQSKCSIKINQMANLGRLNQIYFQRRSARATAFFQQLDSMKGNFNITVSLNTSLIEHIEQATNFATRRWINIYAEDLIKSNLTNCERVLTDFLAAIGLNSSSIRIRNIIENDSYQFIEDTTWWDQSEVAERLLDQSIPPRPGNFTYSNDFYYLHGDSSFLEYLYKNRRCYHEGLFPQWQAENISNRSSTDDPDRCAWKSFDCAFSDIYSFADREQMYQPIDSQHFFNDDPLKCGFAVPSIFDKVRKKYARNDTCKTIVFTSITNCYDPLPTVQGIIHPSFCFVAMLDTRTIEAYRNPNYTMPNISWDLIDLGLNATPFSVAAKSAEVLKIVGVRLFPLAKWIIWLDGKGRINDIDQLLSQIQVPFIGAAHSVAGRTTATEVFPTIARLGVRERVGSARLANSVLDIKTQEQEYKHDGFYARSDALNLTMFDIVVILYRNHHPCIYRYLCGWHNEVGYYSYRGQLSVYYSAVRLNLTNYLHFLSTKFYGTGHHRSVC